MQLKEKLGFSSGPLFLMDGSAFVYRSFYANRHLKRSDGFPTNALLLVTRLLLKILRQEKPEYFLFCMDGKGRNFRHEIYPEYKSNRPPMPEELVLQIEPILEMVKTLGLRVEIAKNCEADDCMASLASRFSKQIPVILISGDKDLKQCLNENTIMWDPAGKEEKILTQNQFEAETGIIPAHWPDVQAIIGDTSDHIPGVPGIGPKTAMQIFSQFPTLEEIKKHINDLPEKLQAKLTPFIDDVFRWRRLTTLKTDACPDITLADLRVGRINVTEAKAIAQNFEMASIAKEIALISEKAAPVQNELPGAGAAVIDSVSEKIRLPQLADSASLPDCAGKTVAIIRQAGAQTEVAVQELDSPFQWQGSTASLCQWLDNAAGFVIPGLKDIIHASPSFMKLLEGRGTDNFFDPALGAYLLDPESGDYEWDRLAAKWRGETGNAELSDPQLALEMEKSMRGKLRQAQLYELFEAIEMPLVPVLNEMEATGVCIDPAAFQEFLNEVNLKLLNLTEEIFQATGCEFNIRSSRQLGEVLLNNLGLSTGKKTKTGQISTSQANLEKLAGTNPVIDKILAYRKLAKLQATYLEPLPRLMDAENRIHSTFNQMATATGRISSSNPNLQNIPVRGEEGQRMRSCFIAPEGNLLIAADYSQIELRVLAHLSEDATLLNAFAKGEDIHTHTAALIFEADPAEISPDQRRMAKTINFGLLYGMGARKLAQELRINEKQAVEFIERYFAGLGKLRKFYEEILKNATDNGFVTTMAGRIRWVEGITSANGQISSQARRQAVNAVIQGTAADIIKLAMIRVANDAELKRLNAKLILQIHDELLIEAPENTADEARKIIVQIMENIMPGGHRLDIPLTVDWGIGKNWAEAH